MSIVTRKLDIAAVNVLMQFAKDYKLTYYGKFNPLQHVLIDTENETYIEVTILDLCYALDNKTPIEDICKWIIQCKYKYISLLEYISLHNFFKTMKKKKTNKTELSSRLIDKVTTTNLDAALKMVGYQLDITLIDVIIDLVELIEEKGDDVSIKDIYKLQLEWMKHYKQTKNKSR